MIQTVNFNNVREYIIDNLAAFGDIQFTATDKTTNRQYQSIYLVEKPQNHEITSGNALIIKFHEMGGGNYVRNYYVEIWISSKNLPDIIQIKDTLVEMLDFYKTPCQIEHINKCRMDSEAGISYDEHTQMYVNRVYFNANFLK